MTGQKFGRLTALYRLYNYHKKGVYWLCVCECGNLTEVSSLNLLSYHTTSCGCLQKEMTSKARKKHGKRHTKIYGVWQGMKRRCYNKNNPKYPIYGGRGITVCDEWNDDFQAFYNWAMSNGYKNGLTLDRINCDGNYEPNNCRWATQQQQQRNRRNNHNITLNGETHCLLEWCEILGVNYNTVTSRLHYGWSVEKALELKGVVILER